MSNETLLSNLDPEVLERLRCSRREAIAKAAKAGLGAAVLTSLPVGLALSAREAYGQGTPAQVLAVLNFALTLEYLEAEFYTRGLASASLIPADRRSIFQTISDHETAHVALLRGAITGAGGTPVAKPNFDFSAGNGGVAYNATTATGNGPYATVFTNYQTFLAVSQAFEDTGVRAYKGQATVLKKTPTLTIALQIHSVEARHAAIIRRLRNEKGWITSNTTTVPGAAGVYAGEENTTQGGVNLSAALTYATGAQLTESFDEPLTDVQVLAIVDPFIV